MQYIYPFLISFIFIFFSELGDKTQILVLSFSAKNKSTQILLGVAIGTFLSHGLAILFGSSLSLLGGENFINYLKIATYITFLVFGIVGFISLRNSDKDESNNDDNSSKTKLVNLVSSILKNCIFIVAITIVIGELGDKTFLASIGLGIQYPLYKFSLICGSICGMLASDSIAIFLGKWLGSKISSHSIDILSNTLFVVFGVIGLLMIIF